jgi:CTP-dependent riboflavin kinase
VNAEVLIGRLATGIGQGKHFTQLDWARAQFMDRLGIDPYPGTVNVIVDDPDSMPVWVRVKRTPGIRIDNPGNGPHDCDARCYPVIVAGNIEGAIVVPEVESYPPAQVEIIASIAVREALGIEDGDPVEIELKPQSGG